MKNLTVVLVIFIITSCSAKKQIVTKPSELDCPSIFAIFEKELLSSCPVSKGPQSVISYLEQFPGYYRNEKFDAVNRPLRSVRFNAKQASIYAYPVLKEKSLFLLNYASNTSGYEGWTLFHTIYFFKNKADKDVVLKRMLKILKEDLNLTYEEHFTIAKESYKRFYLPCGSSGFNFKHGDWEDKHIIDILWVKDAS